MQCTGVNYITINVRVNRFTYGFCFQGIVKVRAYLISATTLPLSFKGDVSDTSISVTFSCLL